MANCHVKLESRNSNSPLSPTKLYKNTKYGFVFQDGTFSFEDFASTFEEYDVQRVMRSYENSISIHVHCCEEGEWKQVG